MDDQAYKNQRIIQQEVFDIMHTIAGIEEESALLERIRQDKVDSLIIDNAYDIEDYDDNEWQEFIDSLNEL